MKSPAREYFNTYTAPYKAKKFQIGHVLFSANWAKECWTTISDKDTELTHWVRFGKVRNMTGLVCYELVIWRFLLMWGSLK